jgi:hypothetical protein
MIPDRQALADMLTRLHLTTIRDQLDSLLDEAAKCELSQRQSAERARRGEIPGQQAGSGALAHFAALRTPRAGTI